MTIPIHQLRFSNFAKATVAGSFTSGDSTINLVTGQGTYMPPTPFRALLWNEQRYPDPAIAYRLADCEIIECTSRSTDALTVGRAIEGTSSLNATAGSTYSVAAIMTAAMVENSYARHANVRAFGAKGDGTTDDTAAIQATFDSMPSTGLHIHFPAGVYKVTSALKFTGTNIALNDNSGGILITGDGIDNTKILGNSLSTAVLISRDITHRFFRITLRDFTVDNTSRFVAGGLGLDLTNCSDCLVDNVRFTRMETGIYAKEASWYNVISHVLTQDVVTGIFCDKGTDPANEWQIRGGKALKCKTGVRLEGTTNTKIDAFAVETFSNGIDVGLSQQTSSTIIDGCRLENTTGTINVTGATNASPIQITTASAHNRVTGDRVVVASVGGNTAANGTFLVTYVDANNFTLDSSTGNGTYTTGGTVGYAGHGIRFNTACTKFSVRSPHFVALAQNYRDQSGTSGFMSQKNIIQEGVFIGGVSSPASGGTLNATVSEMIILSNSGPVTVTNITGVATAQKVTVLIGGAGNVSFTHSSSLRLQSGSNVTFTGGVPASISFFNKSGEWWEYARTILA